MIIILICLFTGIGLGFLGRNIKELTRFSSKLVDIVLCFLLLYLGLSIGLNDRIFSQLLDLGISAIILALGAILGSILFTYPFNIIIKRGKN